MEPVILYDNILASGITATDTETDFSVDNLYDWRSYTFWKAAGSGTKYLTMDAGEAVVVDSIAIYGHNLGTAEATVSVESSATGAWSGEGTEQLSFDATHDGPIMQTFTPASARYWRIKIVTASLPAQISILCLCESLDFPVYPDTLFTPDTETLNAKAELSKSGHLLGVADYYNPIKIDVSFTYPPLDFVDGDFRTFWKDHGRQKKPFFWAHDLDTYPNKTYFVRMSDGYKYQHPQGDITNVDQMSLSMVGVAPIVNANEAAAGGGMAAGLKGFEYDALAWDYDNSDETVAPSSTSTVIVTGGNDTGTGIFTWTISGTDFTLGSETTSTGTNTAIAGSGACGSATITVTQGSDSTTGYVRSTTGQWVTIETNNPAARGVVTGTGENFQSLGYRLIQGKYYYFETVSSVASAADPPCASIAAWRSYPFDISPAYSCTGPPIGYDAGTFPCCFKGNFPDDADWITFGLIDATLKEWQC